MISDNNLRVFLSSDANPYNPVIKKKLVKNHYRCELLDREQKFGSKKRDPLEAYSKIRRNLIKDLNPDLSEDQVDYLVTATKGLIEYDIKKAVNEFSTSGTVTLKQKYPQYPSNTCDPYTGNWAEHLMDIYQLRNVLQSQNFQADIWRGYYGDSNTLLKCLAARSLNILIKNLGRRGLVLSPFFTLCGNVVP